METTARIELLSRLAVKVLLAALSRVRTSTLTRITGTCGLDRNSVTDSSRNADHLGLDDLTWNAGGLVDHLCFANLTAGGVRDFTCPDFLCHRASGVGNLLGDRFTGPRAGRVRNLLGDRFTGPRTGCVRNSLRHGFTGPRAGRVGDSLRDGLLFVTNTGVRNLFDARFGDFTTNRVGLLAVSDFLDNAGAGDRSHFGAGNPASAGHGSAGLFAGDMAATGFVDAFAMQGIPFPTSCASHDFLQHRSRNLFGFRHPVASAEGDFLRFTNGLADGVADIAIKCLRFSAVGRATDFPVFRFTNRLADCAANVFIAGLEAGLADRTANVFVVCLNTGLTDGAADILVASLEAGLLDGAADVFITGLIDRLADGVAFVSVASFVNVSRAGDGNLFSTGFVNRPAAIDCSLFVHGFANSFVSRSAETLGQAVVTARIACGI